MSEQWNSLQQENASESTDQGALIDRFREFGIRLDISNLAILEGTGLNPEVVTNTLNILDGDPEEEESLKHLRANLSTIINPATTPERRKELAKLVQAEINR